MILIREIQSTVPTNSVLSFLCMGMGTITDTIRRHVCLCALNFQLMHQIIRLSLKLYLKI